MKKGPLFFVVQTACLYLSFVLSLNASSLPPEHEAARLLLYIESLVDKQQWNEAESQLDRLMSLETELPIVVRFFAGRIAFEQGKLGLAQKHLEDYVVSRGNDGDHYETALRLITKIEQSGQDKTPEKVELPPIPTESDAYLRSLKALFLTDNSQFALVQHINSLLSSHVYVGSRVKREQIKDGIKYSVSVSSGQLVINKTGYKDGKPTLTVEKLPVYGVDPFVRYTCSDRKYACWISHPATGATEWLWVDRDELVAAELVKAIGKLIKEVQAQN